MKSETYQCNLCLSVITCKIEMCDKNWDGVGIRTNDALGHPRYNVVPMEGTDIHICGRCVSGLRTLFSME